MLSQRFRRSAAAAIIRNVRERALFFRSFVTHPRQVGAILPTSRRAVRDMLDLADLTTARHVVEFGAGTGVYTREVLARLSPDARFLAFEVDPDLALALRNDFSDPRLRIVADSANNVEAYLDGARPDVIVSGLPFTSLPAGLGREILQRAGAVLRPGGTLLVLQYSPLIQKELGRVFGAVRWRLSPFNVPPAFLFACEAAHDAGKGQ